jgi:hypothetical protein
MRFWTRSSDSGCSKSFASIFGSKIASLFSRETSFPGIARTEFKELSRYVPSVARFIAERDVCSSYLRVTFRHSEAKFVDQILAESAAKSGLKFLLEASIFRTGGD